MIKKITSVLFLVIAAGFSFFYTEKAIKIARNNDPIMLKINSAKDDFTVNLVEPIIDKDEYVSGINGCEIDKDESYSKMKQNGQFDENLLVMKEIKNKNTSKNKYIINGNKKERKVSINFLVLKKIDENMLSFIKDKKIKINFFVDGNFLEENLDYIKSISSYGNIYNYGRNGDYIDKYIIYDNNLIETISNNNSNYCITDKKDDEILNSCNNYDMNIIKTKYYTSDNVLEMKENLSNGNIITISDIDDVSKIKMSINYILSKGYDIVNLDKLLNERNSCKY